MAGKQCPLCDKKPQNGGGYSNRVRATKFNPTGMRLRYPNLQWAPLPTGGRIKICTSCLKANKQMTKKSLEKGKAKSKKAKAQAK
jgi:ribosomal protein L28